jgi:hypothetical protein
MDYSFTITHLPGKQNQRADKLSRRPDHFPEGVDNQGIKGIPDHYFHAFQFKNDILDQESQDLEISQMLEQNNPDLHPDDTGILLYKGRIYVPPNQELRGKIIASHHDHPTAGHPGIAKTQELVSRLYWWPRMTIEIADYVKGCTPCQANKPDRQA